MKGAAWLLLAALLVACGDGSSADELLPPGATAGLPGSAARLELLVAGGEEAPPEALAQALSTVAARGESAALPWVLELASHPDEEVRFVVVSALASIGGEQADATLATLARDDASELVRVEASDALAAHAAAEEGR